MPFEHFRTQILLLHSEQGALDKLSAGFSDRYTIHCATTGSEALNTLGEVPIHVIVSAQKLPGMTGLEALREARKRSPETIGILLAGSDNDGLEALVGEKEVFQIVRDEVTPESLRELVENATQQARLVAISESANDQSADADDDSEHIVMETSETGATLITDGTGQRLALRGTPGSPSGTAGSALVDVLVLTKDEQFLRSLKESARGMHTVYAATTLAQADETIRKWNVGVVVIDAAMIGPNVEKLTLHLRQAQSRLVAIVAGRRDDGDMLMDLINRGNVYRFLLKPVSPGRARLAVEASVKQHLEAPDSAFEPKGPIALAKTGSFDSLPKLKISAAAGAPPADTRGTPAPGRPSAAGIQGAPNPAAASAANDELGDDQTSAKQTMSGHASTIGGSIAAPRHEPVASNDPDAPRSSERDGSGGPRLMFIAAVAVVAVATAAFWVLGGSDDAATDGADAAAVSSQSGQQPTEPVTEAARQPVARPAAEQPAAELNDWLIRARAARDAGLVVNPPGDNAIELYLRALDADPGDPNISAELAAIVADTLVIAEQALLDKRIGDAEAALERAALADSENPRLPFLGAQLAEIQLREHLDTARAAIRQSRFEDAAIALDAAAALEAADTAAVQAVADELATARGQQQLDALLAKGAGSVEDGRLTAPVGNNARDFYKLVLETDPDNKAARQGLEIVASKLVLRARDEIDGGNYAAAQTLLDSASELDPTSTDLKASMSALKAAQDRDARARRQAIEARKEAAKRAEADKLAAEKRAAEKAAADKRAAEKAAAEKRAAEKAAADKLAAEKAAADKLAAEKAAADKLAAEKAAADAAAGERAAADETARGQQAASEPTIAPVSVSQLKRIKYVAPKYPRAAQRRNISGWVDVAFTVTTDGGVADIEIRGSEPADTFVNAATKAIEGWKFEPVIENDVPVEKRAAVRLMFALE